MALRPSPRSRDRASSDTVSRVNEPRKPGADENEAAEQLPVAASSLMAMRLTPEMRRAMQVAGATTDGLPKAMQQYKLPLRTWSVPVLAILGLAMVIFVLAFWLNVLTERPGDAHQDGSGLITTLLYQNVEQARNTLGGLGEVMAAVLGLALTVSSIIVQLAATRFTPHITSLFFRARTNLLVLGFFVTATVFVVWVNFSIGDSYVPRWGVLFSMLLMPASLLLLLPYFASVFDLRDTPAVEVSRLVSQRTEFDQDMQSLRTSAETDPTVRGLLDALEADGHLASFVDAIDALIDASFANGLPATAPAISLDSVMANYDGFDTIYRSADGASKAMLALVDGSAARVIEAVADVQEDATLDIDEA